MLHYVDELVDAKSETIDESYLKAFKNYIGAKIILAGKDDIPFLDKVSKRKCDANNIPIGDSN